MRAFAFNEVVELEDAFAERYLKHDSGEFTFAEMSFKNSFALRSASYLRVRQLHVQLCLPSYQSDRGISKGSAEARVAIIVDCCGLQ